MHIALIAYSLQAGGAERVLVNIAGELSRRGHRVSVCTYKPETWDFYSVHPPIERHVILTASPIRSPLNRVAAAFTRLLSIRSAIKAIRPDVVMTFTTKVNARILLSLAGSGIPVIITEHSNPAVSPVRGIWKLMVRWLYPLSAAMVGVSSGVSNAFGWVPESKRYVIHNPIALRTHDGDAGEYSSLFDPGRHHFVTMGRLVHQKGHDLLIDAFARISGAIPEWNLVIVGDGPLRDRLNDQIAHSGMRNRIVLTGTVANPASVLKYCDVFVLSSRSEGFGNVIVEAIICALPVVSFDCDYGPADILTDEVDGILVPPGRVDLLAEQMLRLANDPDLRARLIDAAKSIPKRFAPEVICDQWEELLTQCALQNKRQRSR